MKNILKFKAIGVLTLLLMFSCSPDEKITEELPPIQGVVETLNLVKGGSESFELSGGNNSYELKVEGESVVEAKVEGKKLTITALEKGDAQVTVVSGDKFAVINIFVVDSELGVFEGDTMKLAVMATVQNGNGIWLLEKSNPYAGKRLFISVSEETAKSFTAGQEIKVEVKSKGIDGVKNGADQEAVVEFLSKDVAGIKVGNHLVKIPRK